MPSQPSAPIRGTRLTPLVLMVLGGAVGASAQESDRPPLLPATLCDRTAGIRDAALASPLDELRGVGEITGCARPVTGLIRRAGPVTPAPAAGMLSTVIHARLLPAELYLAHRSGYPDDRNNGALWEGVGLSSVVRAGAEVRASVLTLALRPEILYHQNRPFETVDRERVGYSPFSYPWSAGIDYPQRFGTGSWWELAPGDSYARVDVGWAAAGVSTESLWRGPALRYPILMSNTAGGFPHLFVGTSRGVDVFVGRLGAELVWGNLTESDYFDENPGNDDTRLVNLSLEFHPALLTGLSLGVTRSYHYQPGDDDGLSPVLQAIGVDPTVNLPGNELASVFARWVFAESGAEVFGEWAREDVLGRWAEFLQEPDHSQAYALGFQKATPVNPGLSLRVHGELAHLQEKGELRTNSRPLPIYYIHSQVRQGYTHRGQLLGAGIGPGADAQFGAIDALTDRWLAGGYFERVRRNDMSTAAVLARRWSPYEHDTELTGGLRGMYFHGPFTVSGDLAYSVRYNREFIGDDRSWNAALRATWVPGASRADHGAER